MLGYSDLGNFSRSFKKYVGVSPVEFKEKKSDGFLFLLLGGNKFPSSLH